MNKNKNIKKLENEGYVILNNIIKKEDTLKIKIKLEKILNSRIKKKQVVGHKSNQIIYNFFVEDKSLLKLIDIPQVDKILTKILEPNYVLQSTNAQNRIMNKIDKKTKIKKPYKIGSTWHTDSRYLNNKRLYKGFSYLVIIALDAFTKFNGPTKFVEKSINFLDKPKRKSNYNYKELLMNEGSVCIMDTGMWHKAGDSTSKSRWSIFSIYTGWFVKPYFDYSDFLKKNKISKRYKKLLHNNSIPPKMNEHRGTVTK